MADIQWLRIPSCLPTGSDLYVGHAARGHHAGRRANLQSYALERYKAVWLA